VAFLKFFETYKGKIRNRIKIKSKFDRVYCPRVSAAAVQAAAVWNDNDTHLSME
jgi:hypothetical protein